MLYEQKIEILAGTHSWAFIIKGRSRVVTFVTDACDTAWLV
jgi:hypothetical protein